jgi:hypothetical protein
VCESLFNLLQISFEYYWKINNTVHEGEREASIINYLFLLLSVGKLFNIYTLDEHLKNEFELINFYFLDAAICNNINFQKMREEVCRSRE